MSLEILKVENLISGINYKKKFIPIVDDCSFKISAGSTLGIVGESGSGKSFLALSLMQLLPDIGTVMSGKVIFNEHNILKCSETDMQKIRGKSMAMIFQDPMTSLNPVYTVGHQIAEVFELHLHTSKKESRALALEMLKKVHINSPEKRLEEYPHQLSGGMRQRVMIAMALACKPKLLIADEPTTALDVTIQAQILALMNQLQQEQGTAIILITHDLGVVAETCDDVAIMYAGKIVEKASTKAVFEQPKHPYTQGLLAASPKIGQKKSRLYSISGTIPPLTNIPTGCRFQVRCPLATDRCRENEPKLSIVAPLTNKNVMLQTEPRLSACFLADEI